jgi:preprotein translocase subunit SecG
MAGFAIALFTVILLLVCLFMVIIILMQRSSANAGMGTALGGGAAESVFGGETANVLLKNTVIVAVLFYLLSMGLYLGDLAHYRSGGASNSSLPPAIGAHPAGTGSSPLNPLSGKTPVPETVPVKFVDPKTGNATSAPATAPASTTPAATTSASTTTTPPVAAPATPAAATTTSSAPASAPAAPAPAP